MVQFHEAGLFWQTKLNLQATKAMDFHQQRSIQKGFHLVVKIGVVHIKSHGKIPMIVITSSCCH